MAKKKGNATRRLLVIVGILLVLIVVAAVAATQFLNRGDSATEVEVEDVTRRNVTQVVTASGRIQPEIEVNISPDVSGEIVALPVNEGDHVRQGQLLARIRPDFYEAQVEQADASRLQARASEAQRRADLMSAELDQARQQRLFDAGAVSESDYQAVQTRVATATAAYEGAQYAVAAANARLRESREQLAKTTIYSPMDGTVSMLNVELGERVVGTTQMTGTEMMRIAQLDAMELEVLVNENDVVNVALGDTAAVEVDAYPNRIFKGMVTEIANSARVSGAGTQEQITNFPVKIRILDPHNIAAGGATGGEILADAEEIQGMSEATPNFRPGMSGTVDVFTQTVFDAIAVPIQAVTVRDMNEVLRREARQARRTAGRDSTAVSEEDIPQDEDLRRVVFLMDDGKAKMVEVETGISDDTHIVIRSGLDVDTSVIIGPFRVVSRTLNRGDGVKVQESGARAVPQA